MDKDIQEERAIMTLDFVSSRFFKKYFEPEIMKEIINSGQIKNIKPEKIQESYYASKNKCDVYRGVLNKLAEWAGMKINITIGGNVKWQKKETKPQPQRMRPQKKS